MAAQAVMSIRWNDRGIPGYVDQFHGDEFLHERKSVVSSHLVLTPRGRVHGTAHFRMTVKGTKAILDYAAFREKNTAESMQIGEFHLFFSDTDRTKLVSAEWKADRQNRLSDVAVFQVKYEPPNLKPYAFKRGSTAQRSLRPVKERPGQREFRQQLRKAYGDRCCLTGCSIGLALDGAHIDPFHGRSSDSPQNGILLRKDLHCLFDAGLIAIDPESKRAWFAPEALVDHEYKRMHKRSRLRSPLRGFEAYAPDERALTRRFARFIALFGRR